MTFRERLADWISGGALTRFSRREDAAYEWCHSRVTDGVRERHKLEGALRRIAAMETPNANATVRRMAKTAREALK